MPATNCRPYRCLSRITRAVVPACLVLVACDPVDDPSAAGPVRFRAAMPQPRQTANPNPENAQWLAAWRDLRSRIAPLEEQLADTQQFHAENHFDRFLDLDPETLEKDELCSLFHFIERGYFTVERQILINLLERRLHRSESSVAIPSGKRPRLKDRLAAAMQRDELRMVDLESALQFYRQSGDDDFQIPDSLTDEELTELRSAVSANLDKTRESVAEMDERIQTLKAQLFAMPNGESQRPESESSTIGEQVPESGTLQ